MMIGEWTFTREHERSLREQVITLSRPGPVLRDFQMVLDFLTQHGGVEAAGKYNLLPIKYIEDLDRCLSRPLELRMQRPQLRSHPYLQGLHLLLRASGLVRVEGTGARSRLAVDPAMQGQWNQLNPTEQYFNLLEAWLRFGRAEMVGEDDRMGGLLLTPCMQTCQYLPEDGQRFDVTRPHEMYVLMLDRRFYLLALMDLFGLLLVDLAEESPKPWCPAAVHHVPFGDALFAQLNSTIECPWNDEPVQSEGDGDENEAMQGPRFGAWQALFQPHFPEWRQNLELPVDEPRDGTFVFRVTLGDVWRLIAMPTDDTLDDMVNLILRSINFDDDHMYQITYRDRFGAQVVVSHPVIDVGPWTDEIPIGTLPLEPGQTMTLVYDFGDHREFDIKLERIEPRSAKSKARGILKRQGKAPKQYASGWD
jgi:hypothetical protein